MIILILIVIFQQIQLLKYSYEDVLNTCNNTISMVHDVKKMCKIKKKLNDKIIYYKGNNDILLDNYRKCIERVRNDL